ncbi:hypothetical protein BDQ12DRAFT_619452, partial [Crucibulum laeve]
FGGIHCIAWSFHFPSHIDQLLWRGSACIITGASKWYQKYIRKCGILNALMLIVLLFVFMIWTSGIAPTFISILLYAPARICLLVVALRCLTDLPDSAYQTVQWTKFLPHL